jgi:hypothetical protein
LRRLALIAALILLAATPARAAEKVPGNSCTGEVANSFVLSGGPENGGVTNGMFCNSGTNLFTGIITFQSTGYVGIGTTSPASVLNISSNAGTTLFNDAYGTGVDAVFVGRNARGSMGSPSALQANDVIVFFGGRGYRATTFSAYSDAGIGVSAAENYTDTAQGAFLTFETTPDGSTSASRVERMRVDQNGNVGIGTTAPTNKLTIKQPGNTSYVNGLGIENSADDTGFFINYNATLGAWKLDASYNTTGSYQPMSFWTSATERMRILTNGNVGIGTTSPGTSLDVNGGLTTEPATVNLTADNQVVTVGNRSYIRLASDNATATNRTFCLTAGTSGQYLTLEMSSNKGELLNNSTGCGGASVASLIAGATWTADGNDTIELIYNGTNWLQISRAAN